MIDLAEPSLVQLAEAVEAGVKDLTSPRDLQPQDVDPATSRQSTGRHRAPTEHICIRPERLPVSKIPRSKGF